MKVKRFEFEMIADSRFDSSVYNKSDELDAGICRLDNVKIISTKRNELDFNTNRQVRYKYLAESTDTWKNIQKSINGVKPVRLKRCRSVGV